MYIVASSSDPRNPSNYIIPIFIFNHSSWKSGFSMSSLEEEVTTDIFCDSILYPREGSSW